MVLVKYFLSLQKEIYLKVHAIVIVLNETCRNLPFRNLKFLKALFFFFENFETIRFFENSENFLFNTLESLFF